MSPRAKCHPRSHLKSGLAEKCQGKMSQGNMSQGNMSPRAKRLRAECHPTHFVLRGLQPLRPRDRRHCRITNSLTHVRTQGFQLPFICLICKILSSLSFYFSFPLSDVIVKWCAVLEVLFSFFQSLHFILQSKFSPAPALSSLLYLCTRSPRI